MKWPGRTGLVIELPTPETTKQIWRDTVHRIDELRRSNDSYERAYGFVYQVGLELGTYLLVGIWLGTVVAFIHWFTPFEPYGNFWVGFPMVVGSLTGLLFATTFDKWLRPPREE